MPDTTPLASPTAEAPPSEDGWRPDLAVLRARLDELDDKIHDLLMERALVIENVARSGKAAVFRPGREAAILRRLLARHTGKLPARTVVRMWREMLAGTTAMQTRVTIAATQTAAIAREHFGFLTPVIEYPSARAVLDAVRAGIRLDWRAAVSVRTGRVVAGADAGRATPVHPRPLAVLGGAAAARPDRGRVGGRDERTGCQRRRPVLHQDTGWRAADRCRPEGGRHARGGFRGRNHGGGEVIRGCRQARPCLAATRFQWREIR
jgi:chorismate mutase